MRLLNRLSQDLEAPGERPGRGWVPRRRGGSQNNGIPCVWSPSSTVHIFHESRRGEERVRGRVSPAPARTLGQPSAWSPQSAGHSRAAGVLLSSWPWRRCPVALEAGKDATEPARQPGPARATGAHLRFAQHPQLAALLIQRASGSQEISRGGLRGARDALQGLARPHHGLLLSACLLSLHTQYSQGWSLRPKPKADRSRSWREGSPGAT